MTKPVASTDVYGDFAGLERLKGSARRDNATALRQVAKQFESVFARMMIKSMREAIGKDPIFGSDTAQTYQGMFDDQLSMELTKGKGLGLADMLMRQLQHGGSASPPMGTSANSATGAASGTSSAQPAAAAHLPSASSAEQQNFIQQVWPQAQQASQQLGVTPVSLVAQAALETNWGKSVPHTSGGTSSNNLFGIKAGSSWGGASVTARTQEYENGTAGTVSDAFRAYPSATDSFQDYVALLRSNPRFSGAVNTGNNVTAFATALQQGGYATDPDYARKVTAVAHQVVASLAASAGTQPTSLKFASAAPITGAIRTL